MIGTGVNIAKVAFMVGTLMGWIAKGAWTWQNVSFQSHEAIIHETLIPGIHPNLRIKNKNIRIYHPWSSLTGGGLFDEMTLTLWTWPFWNVASPLDHTTVALQDGMGEICRWIWRVETSYLYCSVLGTYVVLCHLAAPLKVPISASVMTASWLNCEPSHPDATSVREESVRN